MKHKGSTAGAQFLAAERQVLTPGPMHERRTVRKKMDSGELALRAPLPSEEHGSRRAVTNRVPMGYGDVDPAKSAWIDELLRRRRAR